jgi:hypothetical protein
MVTVGYKCVVSFSTFLAERYCRQPHTAWHGVMLALDTVQRGIVHGDVIEIPHRTLYRRRITPLPLSRRVSEAMFSWKHPLPSRTFPDTRKDQIAMFNAEDSGTLEYNNDNTIPARK